MKNFAYVKQEGQDSSYYFYEDNQPVDNKSNITALMMDRLDFNIRIVEIPPVSNQDIRNLLSYRLRSLYPGDPGLTEFDYKIITKNKKRYAILFITSKQHIEDYRAQLGDKKPLFLPYSIAEKHIQKQSSENVIYFFWNYGCVDIMVFDNKTLSSSTAIRREKEIFLDILKIKNIVPQNYKEYTSISFCLQEELEQIKEQSTTLFKDTTESIFIEIESTILTFNEKTDFLFNKKKQSLDPISKVRLEFIVFPFLILCCILFNKYIVIKEEYKHLLEANQAKELKMSKSQKEYGSLLLKLAEIKKTRPLDIYLVLSEISQVMARDAILYNFKMSSTNRVFVIEGEAYNPLRFVDKLNNSSFFKNVIVDQSSPLEGINKESFKITGEFDVNK